MENFTKKKAKVSIVIPVYNVAMYIEECLSSVAAQDYDGPMECLLVDDCGQDNSVELAEGFIADYDGPIEWRIIYREKNGGQSAARNIGIEVATGDYITFVDSDDVIKDTYVSDFMKFVDKHRDTDVVVCAVELMGELDADLPKLSDNLPILVKGEEVVRSFARFEWNVLVWSKIYRSSFLKDNKIKFYEGIIHEDNLWSFDVASHASSLGIVRSANYKYRIREGSTMTGSKATRRVNSLLVVLEEIRRRIETDTYEVRAKLEYLRQIMYHTLNIAVENYSYADCKDIYIRLCNATKWKLSTTLKLYGMKIRPIIRDIHFALPSKLGYKVCVMAYKKSRIR